MGFGGPEPSAVQHQEAFEEPAHVQKEVFNEQPPETHHQEVFEQPPAAAVASQPEPVFEQPPAPQPEVFEPPQRATRATRTSKRNQQQEVFEQSPAAQLSEVFEQPAPVFEPAPSF